MLGRILVKARKKKADNHVVLGFPLAAELGFEPRQYESESQVLPLHHSAIARKIFPRSVVCPVFVTRQLGRWVIC